MSIHLGVWHRWTMAVVAGLLLVGSPAASAAESTPAKSTPTTKSVPARGASSDDEIKQAINARLAEKWKENKLTPSNRASDYEFIRRASLDIIGRIATPKEISEFLRDPEAQRRAKLIDRLLNHKEYANNFANIWTVLLMTRSGATGTTRIYHEQLHQWLEDAFAENKSWKEIATGLLTATGKSNENGAVNYVLANLGEKVPARDKQGYFTMVPVTSRTTRLFLGVQTQCTQCHDHPFNTGKQVNFWSINAFFRQVTAPKGQPDNAMRAMARPLELEDSLDLNPDGLIFYETRKGTVLPAKPIFFLDNFKLPDPGVNRRQELAKEVTQSPYFAKAYVNRMWLHFFGRAFTNPVDDFGDHNEPSNPQLLDELASAFAHYGYDSKRLIRWICTSDAYSLNTVANKTNEKSDVEPLFSRMLLKAMTPEQLFESLMIATQPEQLVETRGVKNPKLVDLREKRKKLREKWISELTANFGDDEGNEVTFNGTVVQALMMINGSELNSAISSKDGGTVVSASAKQTVKAKLDYLFLAALNRPPTGREIDRMTRVLRTAPAPSKDPLAPLEDVFWALLNSNEFILNH
jgi:hypothetical protein